MKKILLFLLLFCGLVKAQPNQYPVHSYQYPPVIFLDSIRIINPSSGDTLSYVTTGITSLPSLAGVGTLTIGSTGAGFTLAVGTSTVSGQLPVANGGELRNTAATSSTTGTMTVTMNTRYVTNTPTGGETFNASGGVTGQTTTFIIVTSGTSSFNLNWGTNFKQQATLSTGTTAGKVFMVSFTCIDGTNWYEISQIGPM